jgi:hypothetical protein
MKGDHHSGGNEILLDPLPEIDSTCPSQMVDHVAFIILTQHQS